MRFARCCWGGAGSVLKRSVLFKISTPQVPEAPYLNFNFPTRPNS